MVRRVWLLAAGLLLAGCPQPDITPPRVRIVFPQEGDTLAGADTILVVANDNQQIRLVQLTVDDSLVAADSLGRDTLFEFVFDGGSYPAGTVHTLLAIAYDRAGNCDSSPPVEFLSFPLPGSYHSGTITRDELWRADASPHYVLGTLRVEAQLTIEAGAEIRLGPGATITVGSFAPAGLRAEGTTSRPVRFTASDSLNCWNRIEFNPHAEAGRCILNNCIFEFGGSNGALLVVNSSRISIENSVFRRSAGNGLVVSGTGFSSFRNNTVTGCDGAPLVLSPPAAGTLGTGNRFTGNRLDRITITPGAIERTLNLPNPDVPYLVTGTITIAGDSAPVVFISPGCSLLFTDSARLRIGVGRAGGLVADGSSGEIVFAGIDRNFWGGIEFWNWSIAGQCRFKDCRIENAGRNGVAALICYAPITLLGTELLASASAGIYLIGTGFEQFENNTISSCASFPVHIEAQFVSTMGAGNRLNGNGRNYIEVVGGVITQDAVWQNHQTPYRLTGSVDVGSPFAPALFLNPGVELQFTRNCGLRIGELGPGRLIAIGVPDSIRFTGDTTVPGSWRALEFAPLTGSGTTIDHCQLFFGGGGGATAEVVVRTSSPTIRYNEIAWSGKYCIALFNSPLDPELLRQQNWLHDWAEGYDDIYDEGP
ncbi:MAG: right-handed parallel beta-helix repeat-containing protein [candidate division WOR-3 bacterium]